MDLYNIHTHKADSDAGGSQRVHTILNTYPQDFDSVKAENPDMYYSCGIHPWYSDDAQKYLAVLKDIIADPAVVAIGEAGLDKLQGPPMDVQTDIFEKQIQLAIDAGKPLIIHCVKAWDELIALHKEYKSDSAAWIIHGYRGNPQQTEQLCGQGFKFSIGEKFNPESVKSIPKDSIFCETDTSDISICKIYEDVSGVIGVELNHFAIFVEENIQKVFNI